MTRNFNRSVTLTHATDGKIIFRLSSLTGLEVRRSLCQIRRRDDVTKITPQPAVSWDVNRGRTWGATFAICLATRSAYCVQKTVVAFPNYNLCLAVIDIPFILPLR